ncbi:MAG: hypothetical protein ACI85I_002404 [Arenicella sp.]
MRQVKGNWQMGHVLVGKSAFFLFLGMISILEERVEYLKENEVK